MSKIRSFDYQVDENSKAGKLTSPEVTILIPPHKLLIHNLLELSRQDSNWREFAVIDERKGISADDEIRVLTEYKWSGNTYFSANSWESATKKRNLLIIDTPKLKILTQESVAKVLEHMSDEVSLRTDFLADL